MVLPAPVAREEVMLRSRSMAFRHLPGPPGAPPAIFVHGLGGSSLNWTDLMVALSADVDGWAVELNGFGDSPPARDGDASPEGHARGVAEFIEHTCTEPVHLFGNSLGGAVALQLAARRPELVRSLTLLSPALPTTRMSRFNAHLPVISLPGVGEQFMSRYRRLPVEQRVQATIDLCMANPDRLPQQRIDEAIEDAAERDDLPYVADEFVRSLRGLMATYLDRGAERPWKLAERVQCRTLVVYGRLDPLVDSRSSHRVTSHFTHADVMLINDCGHVAQLEYPELVAEEWRRVCRGE